ncbi:MAG: hypothetical protein IJS01_13115 [Lentisphaeria bacterium]|nr:hypothetical protein [Lentisphaeria bacterium]
MTAFHLFVAEIGPRVKFNAFRRTKMTGKTHTVNASFRKHSRREMPFIFPAESGACIPKHVRLDLHADLVLHGKRGKAGVKEKRTEDRQLLPFFSYGEGHFQMRRFQFRCFFDCGRYESGNIFHFSERTAVPVETQVQFPRIFPAKMQRILSIQGSCPKVTVLQGDLPKKKPVSQFEIRLRNLSAERIFQSPCRNMIHFSISPSQSKNPVKSLNVPAGTCKRCDFSRFRMMQRQVPLTALAFAGSGKTLLQRDRDQGSVTHDVVPRVNFQSD